MGTLVQRAVTAVLVALALVLVLFAAPTAVSLAVLAVLMLLGAWEWSAFVGLRRTRHRAAYAFALAGLLLVVGTALPPGGLLPVLLVSLAWWSAAFLWILRFPTPIPRAFAAVAGALVLGPAWLALARLLAHEPDGAALVMLALGIVWSADIGAYFVGRRAGRLKLAPGVSPGKTWEGVMGGLAVAGAAAAIGGRLLDLPLAVALPAGIGVAAISVVGDLTESMFKRNVGLKDSGRIFPGHGGVLDRIDSITAAVPVFTLVLYWAGRL